MKNLVRNSFVVIAVIGIIAVVIMNFYPNVVTGISPVRDPGKNAKDALQNVAKAKDKTAALTAALNQLPVEGKTLEEKVASWVRYDFNKIDSMKFVLVSGIGISATDAKNKIHEGTAYHQVVVRIYSSGKCTEYFLECANGLVSKRWPKMVSEKPIGQTRTVEHNTVDGGSVSQNVYIPKGGSLCGTLGMKPAEALAFAKKFHFKHWYFEEKLFVLIYTSDVFHKYNDVWEPIEIIH